MAKKFAYDRLFGSDVKEEIAKKLEARQNLSAGVNFGESFSESNKTNFEGVSELSSRRPWGRMWSVIQNYSLSPNLETCQKKALEDSENYKADVVINDIKVYKIGTADFNDLTTQSTSSPGQMKDFQSSNQYFKPGIGISSIRSESSGHMGLIKSTVIQFKVFNFYDFDNIVLPFFLTPGSTIFCDFGWDTSYMYEPEHYLTGTKASKSFNYKSFYQEIFGDDGMIGKSNGDLDVIVGVVSKYDVQVDAQGNFDCTITLTSQNYALLDNKQDAGIPLDLKLEDRVWDIIAERMRADGIDIKKIKNGPNEAYGDVTKKILATYVGGSTHHETMFAMYGVSKSTDASSKNFAKFWSVIPDVAYDTGVYFRCLDNPVPSKIGQVEQVNHSNSIYITFKLFAELLNELLASRKDQFVDGDIEFIFENIPVKFNKYLYVRQFYSTHYDKQQLAFIYPTRKKDSYEGTEGPSTSSSGATNNYNEIDEINKLRAVDLGDLFLNLDKILTIFRSEKSIELALKKILKSIDDDSFGVIKLMLISDGTKNDKIKIVDSNFYPDVVETNEDGENIAEIFQFKVFSPNTITNSMNLSMNMGSSAMANRLAIQGATSDRMLFPASDEMRTSIADADLNREFANNQFFAHLPTTTKENTDDYMMATVGVFNESLIKAAPSTKELAEKAKEIETANKQAAFSKGSMFKDMQTADKNAEKPPTNKYFESKKGFDLTDPKTAKYFPKNVFLDNIHTYFKFRILDSEVETKSFANVLLPYTLTLTIYGISGITPGNRFRIDYLPERYRKRTYFVARKVSHDIGPQGWKTTIEASMRLWGNDTYKNIVKYRPIVHLSKRKLYSMGYCEPERDKIQDNENNMKDPKDFWTVRPECMSYGCRDQNANNFSTTRYDCVGNYEGSDNSCCTYPAGKEPSS